jgi:hypothetical protein
LKSGSKGGDIEINTKGNIEITATKDITLSAQNIITKSKGETTMDVGTGYKMSAGGQMLLKSSATGTIQSGAGLVLAAPTIHMNKN